MSAGGSALRHLPRPRAVLIDPWRAWVPPQPGPGRAPGGRSRVAGQSFELRRGPTWMPAHLDAWARLAYTPGKPEWFGHVAVDFTTGDGTLGHTFRLWLPADAVRLPDPSHPAARGSR